MAIKQKEKLSASIEDYLEAIYLLDKTKKAARVKDISKELGVSMPSVHQALHILKDNNLITHENYGYIELTREGKRKGKDIYHKHQILSRFFAEVLNVPLGIAEQDACRIEHNISPETLKRLVAFIKFADTYPYPGKPDWLKSFNYFFKTGKRPKECDERIEERKTK